MGRAVGRPASASPMLLASRAITERRAEGDDPDEYALAGAVLLALTHAGFSLDWKAEAAASI